MSDFPVRLKPGDLAQLENLLRENGLPHQDCAEPMAQFIGIFEQTKLIAAGGLENVGVCGLLRSIVVAQNNRSMGLGREIMIALLQQAETQRLETLYLLTETAESYFEQFGFVLVDRQLVPEAIRKTRQFDSLCPASASCMVLQRQASVLERAPMGD